MKVKACEHCFCRTKTVPVDALAIRSKRVRYCCWCGEEKGHDELQARADAIYVGDRAQDLNEGRP